MTSNNIRISFHNMFGFLTTAITFLGFLSTAPVFSLPQFAVIEGAQCINCHATHQGGGIRNTRGRFMSRSTGMFNPEKVTELQNILNENNSLFNDRLSLGSDLRFQMARSHKSEDAKRRFFPMQAAIYSTCTISERLFIEASYNFGPQKFFGQQKWTASLVVHPKESFTQLRLGYFQPSIGLRYDDHTMLIRQAAGADGSPLIAPNYAEYGAEFSFYGMSWMTVTGGIFDAGSLSENFVRNKNGTVVSLITDESSPTALGRLEFRHRLLQDNMPLRAGSSLYANKNFYLLNVFSGIGLYDKLSVIVDYAYSKKSSFRTTTNIMGDVTYKPYKHLSLFLRGEHGKTTESFSGRDFESHTNQYTAGVQFFLMPSIELRPEYRIVDTEQFRSTRIALQLHLFI